MYTKNARLFLTAAAALAVGASAQAQGIAFDGAYVQGEYIANIYNGGYDYSQSGVNGAVQASIGQFALQVDLGVFTYDIDPPLNSYFALHAMYNISPNIVVGGYYGVDLWNDGAFVSPTYGVEAKFTPGFLGGRMGFEAFAGTYLPYFTSNSVEFMGLGVDYAITDRISVGASYLRAGWYDLNDPADRYDVLEVEGTYNFTSGLYATASYTNRITQGSSGEDTSFGIAVGFNFGDGVTFERRGFSGLYPGR